MKHFTCFIGVFLLLLLHSGAASMGEAMSDLTALLPAALKGWQSAAKEQMYNRENLYDYINGGAELYLSYGFKKVVSRTYLKPDQPEIVVDLFDMGTSQNAFGVFSHARETVDKTFGQGSQYTAGLLLFWQDHYFVSILAMPETVISKRAVFGLATIITKAIAKQGPLPEILKLLPPQSLVKESVRYFHHHVWLNSYYYVADHNILHINEKTDALLAKYGEKGQRSILLLVQYRQGQDAKLAYNDFAKYYLPELSQKSVAQIEDGTWTGCQLAGNLLIIVFNAATEDKATHLLAAVKKNEP